MNQVSELMRDQMESPLERAIYWLEYVIRHRGAPHLRASSRKLSLFQRCLFDVMLFSLSLVFFLSISTFFLCRFIRQKVQHETTLKTFTKKNN
jgi:glucuronosyltransferase